MFNTRKIAYNTIIQIIGKAANVLIGVFAISYLTRYLSPDGFGKYTTVLTFLQMFGIFLDFGLYIVLLQEFSKPDIDRSFSFSNVMTMRIISGLSFFVIAPAIGLFFPYPSIIKWGIFLTSFSFFLISINQVYSAVFQREMKMHKVVLAETIGKIFFLGAILFFIYIQGNLLLVLMANNIHALVFFLFLAFSARKYVKYKWTINLKYWKKILILSWPIALTTVLNLIYFKADTLFLSLFKPASDVGFYGAPYKILEVITSLPHLILGLVLPIFAFYWFQKDYDNFKKSFQKIFNLFIVLTLGMITIFTAEARGIINFIAGEDYQSSIGILQILIWPTAFIFFSSLFNYGIIAIEKQKETIKYFFITAMVALTGYLIFIPPYGYWGAALMTLGAEALITIFSYNLLQKHSQIKIRLNIFWKTLISAAIVFLFLNSLDLNFVVELIIGITVYSILLFCFRVLSKDLVKEVISHKP
jgi:O-antigen/teichoic acid export membrane protein